MEFMDFSCIKLEAMNNIIKTTTLTTKEIKECSRVVEIVNNTIGKVNL